MLPNLVIYPGEGVTADGVTVGTIYVVNGHGERYEMAGGPPPGNRQAGPGGHFADVTPAGEYTLDHAEHHVTANWPLSVVPWGSRIREHDGEIEYQVGQTWIHATGPRGTVTRAMRLFVQRSNSKITLEDASREARRMFFRHGSLVTDWIYNDFGKWSWNLKSHGHRSAYYIHTTPRAEREALLDPPQYESEQSHGCKHIRPIDRDEMMARGYLAAGNAVRIMKYGIQGPPR